MFEDKLHLQIRHLSPFLIVVVVVVVVVVVDLFIQPRDFAVTTLHARSPQVHSSLFLAVS